MSAFPFANRFAGRDFRYWRCADCGTCFIDPVPDPELQAALFAPDAYHATFYADDDLARDAATAERFAAWLPKGGRVLDYGCGNGHLLVALQEQGLDPIGVELSPSAAAFAQDRSGHPVFPAASQPWREQRYDGVHLRDVIGHLPEPVATLNGLLARLRPGGILMVEGALEANPSLVRFTARLLGRIRRAVTSGIVPSFPPYDLNFATAASQRAMFGRVEVPLVEVDWRIRETGWPYRHNGAVKNAIALAAIAASQLPFARTYLGNRFTAIYRRAL